VAHLLPKQLDPQGRDKRGLIRLLQQATDAGLLRQEDLSGLNLEYLCSFNVLPNDFRLPAPRKARVNGLRQQPA
jgi:hypothetical protein